MPDSLDSPEVQTTFADARHPSAVQVVLPETGRSRLVRKPFPSPVDWRDHWIYFLMVDRFNNPSAPPAAQWDAETGVRQGGTFEGIRRQLPYLQDLGVGALWLTPVLKNRRSEASHHGYGIQDFLEVEPRFGSAPGQAEDELIRLVNEAHARRMYVIFDVVINHAGDLFAYEADGNVVAQAHWRDTPYPVQWRDEQGNPRPDWPSLPDSPPREAGVWPRELQANEWFRRQGEGGPQQGDFASLKEFRTEQTDVFGDHPVWNRLIKAFQYAIARFDADGFRIDTLKHVEREFALTFCNAVREYALSIGKKNLFLFGENKSDDEALLAAYTGRFTSEEAGRLGADAALDFPLQWKLVPVAKGFQPPTLVEDMFDYRKSVHAARNLLSTHGEASRFFVTFIDNHDDHHRFLYPRDGGDYSHQLTLALAVLFALQGIPCLYYGTEQGLQGTQEIYAPGYAPDHDGKPEHVREALWGKPNAFDRNHPLYAAVRDIAALHAAEPALRYGRQYFRPVSGNDLDFGPSVHPGGVLAFARILNDREVIVAANTSASSAWSGWVLIDPRINDDTAQYQVAFSNQGTAGAGTPVSGQVRFHGRDGAIEYGWARRLFVDLTPMEIQILVRA